MIGLNASHVQHDLLASSDVVKGNELGLSEGLFGRHLDKAKVEGSLHYEE